MKRTLLGILIASVVLYMFGFLWWGGALPYATAIWKQPVEQDTVRVALRKHFPDNGVYFVPGFNEDQAAAEKLTAEGPVAFVHMLAVNGRPLLDPQIMVGGFVLNVAAIVLMTLLLQRAAPALPRYAQRVGFTALAGLTAALLMDGGDVVWWQIDVAWKLYIGAYHLLFWSITGMILAWAVPSRSPAIDRPAAP
jgi:hypothetical protein